MAVLSLFNEDVRFGRPPRGPGRPFSFVSNRNGPGGFLPIFQLPRCYRQTHLHCEIDMRNPGQIYLCDGKRTLGEHSAPGLTDRDSQSYCSISRAWESSGKFPGFFFYFFCSGVCRALFWRRLCGRGHILEELNSNLPVHWTGNGSSYSRL